MVEIRDGNFCPTRGYLVRSDPNGPDFTRSDKKQGRVQVFTKIWPKLGPGPTRLYIYIVTKIPSYTQLLKYPHVYIVITLKFSQPHLTLSSLQSPLKSHLFSSPSHASTLLSFKFPLLISTQAFKPHLSPPLSDQDNPRRQAQRQSSIKHLADKPSHHHETLNHRELPLTCYRPTTGWVWVFFFSCLCEQNLGLGFVFVSQICGYFFFYFCWWDFQIC